MTKRIPVDEPTPLVQRPFSGLAGLSAPAQVPVSAPPAKPMAEPVKNAPAWAVVRLERKGRGGKEVTVVEKLELRASELDRWAKSLKQALAEAWWKRARSCCRATSGIGLLGGSRARESGK